MTGDEPEAWVPYPVREHRRRMAELEAAGQDLWVETLDQPARNKLAAATRRAINDRSSNANTDNLVKGLAQELCDKSGMVQLPASFVSRYGDVSVDLFLENIRNINYSVEMIFGLIELFWRYEATHSGIGFRKPESQGRYATAISEVLEDHRVKFLFVNGNFLPRDGSLIDTEVVVPALHFLIGDERYADAEQAYMRALKSVGENRPHDAISHAYTALQTLLQALGCGRREDALLKQLRSAVSRGILAQHDQALEGWLTSDRGNRSSSHPTSAPPTRQDAWLAVHVVGALMLRLGRGAPRSGAK